MKSKEKKEIALWYIVLTNYLSTFIGAAFLVVIPTFVLAYYGVIDGRLFSSTLGQIAITAINLLVLAFTSWQTALYIKETYVIHHPKKVLKYTLFVAIGASVVGLVLGFFLQNGDVPTLREYAMYFATDILSLLVFYFVNKKFLTGSAR